MGDMKTGELLIELASEEIPARFQDSGAAELAKSLAKRLEEAGLGSHDVTALAGPRRISLVVSHLPLQQNDQQTERKGPSVNAPEGAIQGFMRSCGVTSLDELTQQDSPKGAIYFFNKLVKGRPTDQVLPALINDLIKQHVWPKSMRFADQQLRWVRPLQRVLVIFNGKPVKGQLDLGSDDKNAPAATLEFCDVTYGHFLTGGDKIKVTNFASYKAALEKAGVMLDGDQRRTHIHGEFTRLAKEQSLTIREDQGLLNEVAGLVETPVPMLGKIDKEFMALKDEILIASLRLHQKYFCFYDEKGKLAPWFGVVANLNAKDGGKAIIAGNERVLRARLADARFFWDQDSKDGIDALLPKLETRLFHNKLGTMAQKRQRVMALAKEIASHLGLDTEKATLAASLAKADLASQVVGEFPELQGLVGGYLAEEAGHGADIATAVREHYKPAGPNDQCPSSILGAIISIADKMDSVLGFWIVDERPTGSKDPFGIRRAIIAMIRIMYEMQLPIRFHMLVERTIEQYKIVNDIHIAHRQVVITPFGHYLLERYRVFMSEQGLDVGVVESILRHSPESFYIITRKAEILQDFVQTDEGRSIIGLFKRVHNILDSQKQSIIDKDDIRIVAFLTMPTAPSRYDFKLAEEIALFTQVETIMQQRNALLLGKAKKSENYDNYKLLLTQLLELAGPLNDFFANVKVVDDDKKVRNARFQLLRYVEFCMLQLANFSLIQTSDDAAGA